MKREIKFRKWSKNTEGKYRMTYVFDYDELSTNPKYWNFIPMQFTGLKDKNGKEIYEGDILKVLIDEIQEDMRQYENYQVNFREGCFAVNDLAIGENYSSRELEVIGNLYENPELLK